MDIKKENEETNTSKKGISVNHPTEPFSNDTYKIMGVNLTSNRNILTTDTDAQNTQAHTHTQTDKVIYKPADGVKILRLSVDGDVNANPHQIFEYVQKSVIQKQKLPKEHKMKSTQENLIFDYHPTEGDEITMGTHTQDIKWIGPDFLGTIFVDKHGNR